VLGRVQAKPASPVPASEGSSAREALACLETAEPLGWLQPLEPEFGALFHRVIGTLVARASASL
jgi:hypothetical protein